MTDEWFVSGEPVFSADGKYLFFVSHRNYHPRRTASGRDEDDFPFGMARIYFVTLAKDTKSLLAPKSDEVEPGKTRRRRATSRNTPRRARQSDAAKKVVVKVDVDGLAERIGVLPLPPSSYGHLTSVGDRLYYCRKGYGDGQAQADGLRFRETEGDRVARP